MVGRPSQIASSGWEAHPKGLEWSEGPPGGQGAVDRPSRRAGSGQEALPEDWEWLTGSSGGPEWSGDSPAGQG